jgi:hypothetical protein
VSDTIEDARRMIESRLAEIAAEARQLEDALAHLAEDRARSPRRRRGTRDGKTTSQATPPSQNRPRKPSRRMAAKRAPRGRRREELLAPIKASPGARASELAARIGIRPTQVSVLIAKARAERLIVRHGDGYALRS